jgi:CheY-like chemotaxis protein
MIHALVAEDEVMIREILCDELSDTGMDVRAYASAEEALGAIESGVPIDLLFTDIHLAGPLSGWDLGREARALHPDLRVIYATGGNDGSHTLTPLERRIMKPYRFANVIALLQELGFNASIG